MKKPPRMALPGSRTTPQNINGGCCAAARGAAAPWDCRSAFRYFGRPENASVDDGFRVCCLPQDLAS